MSPEQGEQKGGDVSIRHDLLGSTEAGGADGPELAVVDPAGDEAADDSAPRRVTLTFAQAAEATGVSKSTIRRMFERQEFPQAFKDPSGTWRLPVEDLLVAGLVLHRTDRGPGDEPGSLTQEFERLQVENRVLRERLQSVTALAEERGERIHDLRLALRMLPASWAERFQPSGEPTEGAPAMAEAESSPRPEPSAQPAPDQDPSREDWLRAQLRAERDERERLAAMVARRGWFRLRGRRSRVRRGRPATA
jgi:hypothetical protein